VEIMQTTLRTIIGVVTPSPTVSTIADGALGSELNRYSRVPTPKNSSKNAHPAGYSDGSCTLSNVTSYGSIGWPISSSFLASRHPPGVLIGSN
jgi:hypothetical protein